PPRVLTTPLRARLRQRARQPLNKFLRWETTQDASSQWRTPRTALRARHWLRRNSEIIWTMSASGRCILGDVQRALAAAAPRVREGSKNVTETASRPFPGTEELPVRIIGQWSVLNRMRRQLQYRPPTFGRRTF